ncbi:MAG: type II secretion system F family protein [Candidatus Marsarchaeota archaeon]|nr:type II secretion system F family protein [Candidatus Marsarchaeota archaeon]
MSRAAGMERERGPLRGLQVLLSNADMAADAGTFAARFAAYGTGFGIGAGLIFFSYSPLWAAGAFLAVAAAFWLCVYAMLVVAASKRVALIEDALPDFLNYMASNIRSGVTHDRALLLSARKEFGPLAKEVDRAAKETFTGKPLAEALLDTTTRVHSPVFSKTMRLIVEGLESGGNLADLLENTAADIRRFDAIRKEVSATALVYQLFMFAAVAIGAPLLYAVANFLVEMVSSMKERIGSGAVVGEAANLPFAPGGAGGVSPELVFWFSLAALAISVFFGSLAAGVISKGRESEGFPYVPILLAASFGVFFVVRFALEAGLGGAVLR